jgi:hypothetical protein
MIWKKPVVLLSLFYLLQTCHAQIAKNTLMLGGSLGFQFTTDHEDHVNTGTFNFAPVFADFVAKNFVLGIAPFISYTASSGQYDSPVIKIHTSTLSMGLGPYARYYIRIGPRVYMFIHGSPSIMATWDTYSSDPKTPISRTISAAWVIGPGLSVMVTKSVAVELSIYYQGMYHRSAQFENGNVLGAPGSPYVDNGMVFNVGFQVYLERNKKNVRSERPNGP